MVVSCALLAPLLACGKKEEYKARSFAYYQPILDRMPFGAPPPEVPPELSAEQAKDAAQVQAEQQKLAKQINMSCINVTPGGATAIGFTDLNEKPPLNFYLLVGATGGGWKVLDANYDEEWAQIEKDGVTITLKLGKGLIDGPPVHEATAQAQVTKGPDSAGPTAAEPENAVRTSFIKRPSLGGRATIDVEGIRRSHMESAQIVAELNKIKSEGGDVASYAQRLRERKMQEKNEKQAAEQEAREKLQELAKKITQEELKKREHEINLSLIEQGSRPISNVELTPEEESQLIEKGVLAQ